MAKVIQNHKDCIGCGSCTILCPKFWEMDEKERKAVLKNAKKNKKGEYELEVKDKKDIECNKSASNACPVNVIRVEE